MRSLQLEQLAERLRAMEAEHCRKGAEPIALPGWGEALPRLTGGSLVELLSETDGTGAWSLGLLVGRQAMGERKVLVVADGQRRFYPPAARACGIDLERTLVLRARPRDHLLAALTQALHCPAVAAVIGDFETLNATEYRRLQLAAETGGGVGLLLLPVATRSRPSFAAVRLRLTPLVSEKTGRRMELEVLRVRGGKTGKAGRTLILEFDHEAGDVCFPAGVAVAVPS